MADTSPKGVEFSRIHADLKKGLLHLHRRCGCLRARTIYSINDNFQVSAEAISLFSEPKEQFAFVNDGRYAINDYGPRTFFGIRGRF